MSRKGMQVHARPVTPSRTLDRLSPRAQQIVLAARDLLEREGVQALSMRRLADQVGMRAPSLYEHLRDKEALQAVLVSLGFEEQAELFDQAVQRSPDVIGSLTAAYRDFARRQPHLYRLMTERPFRRDLLTPGVEEAAALPLVQATGGDLEHARAIWAFAHGMVVLEMNGRFPPGADLDGTWRKGIDRLAVDPVASAAQHGADPRRT